MPLGQVEVQAHRQLVAQRLQGPRGLAPARCGGHATGGRQPPGARQLLHGIVHQRVQRVVVGAQDQRARGWRNAHALPGVLKAQILLNAKVPTATSISTISRLTR